MILDSPVMAMASFGGPQLEGATPSGAGLKPVSHVRKIFPETWLWMNETLS